MRGITGRYFIKRVLFALLTLWVAITLDFLLPRLIKGDPAQAIASTTALGSEQYVKLLRKQFGLDNPSLLYQYKQFVTQLAHGNLGISYGSYPTPVYNLLRQSLPWTLLIVGLSVVLSFVFGWFLAMRTALKNNKAFDRWTVSISFYLQAMPYYWIAMMLVMFLSLQINVFPLGHAFPAGGIGEMSKVKLIVEVLYHATLPVISLLLVSLAGRLLVMRNNILQILSEDYMVLAEAKGLRRRRIRTRYAFRNALLPSFTGLMLSLGNVVSGAILTEIIFSYPGVGLTMYNGLLNHDYPVIQGTFLVVAISIIIANLIADLCYPLIDPRVTLT
ncbi:MAG TPA: ABC transporter permease [Spirochaetia bacterium]|nr:ABC transporter permease [Spirochaetia bacterium]